MVPTLASDDAQCDFRRSQLTKTFRSKFKKCFTKTLPKISKVCIYILKSGHHARPLPPSNVPRLSIPSSYLNSLELQKQPKISLAAQFWLLGNYIFRPSSRESIKSKFLQGRQSLPRVPNIHLCFLLLLSFSYCFRKFLTSIC